MLPVSLLLLSLGAGGQDVGRALFYYPGLGKSGASCASCHTLDKDESDGLIRAGHSLYDVARRRSWRGDQSSNVYPRLEEAIGPCLEIFMLEDNPNPSTLKVLARFLQREGAKGAKRPPLVLQTGLEAGADYDRPYYRDGNAAVGQDVFYRACHSCHPHGNAGLGPSIAGRAPAETVRALREGNGLLRGKRKPGAWSPAFGVDRISREQAADVAAYIATLSK